jgi:hypothetical protein
LREKKQRKIKMNQYLKDLYRKLEDAKCEIDMVLEVCPKGNFLATYLPELRLKLEEGMRQSYLERTDRE